MKKFFVGALTALMLWSFGAFTEAQQLEQENFCCREYYCAQDCDDSDSESESEGGEYCGRYGCRR